MNKITRKSIERAIANWQKAPWCKDKAGIISRLNRRLEAFKAEEAIQAH